MSPSNRPVFDTVATIDALVELIAKAGSLDEVTISELVTSSEFQVALDRYSQSLLADYKDFATDDELVDASPLPLSLEKHLELIHASFPSHINEGSELDDSSSPQRSMADIDALACLIRDIDRTSASSADVSQWPFPPKDALTPAVVSSRTTSAQEQEEAIKRAIGEKLHSYIKARLGLR